MRDSQSFRVGFFFLDTITDTEINSSLRLYAFVILNMFFDPKTRHMLTFHLCLEPIASRDVDSCRSRGSSLLGTVDTGRELVHGCAPGWWGCCLQGGQSLLLRVG